jgi:hypothetical protein
MRIFLLAGLCLFLAGCGQQSPKKPQGHTGKWKFGDTTYSYTPDKLTGTWIAEKRTVTFHDGGPLPGTASKARTLS